MEGATIQPQNNKQAYLAYALGLITDASHLPEPKTAEEALLKEYCLNGGGGGSIEPFITNISYMFNNGARTDMVPEILALCGQVTQAYKAFIGAANMDSVDITGLDISKATSLMYFFGNCTSLMSVVGLETLDVSSVTDLSSMFSYCFKVDGLYGMSGWDVSKVTKMNNMFCECKALTDASFVKNWDVHSCSMFNSMFQECAALKNIDAAGWNMSSATDISYMFNGCRVLGSDKTQDFSEWDVRNVTNMDSLFRYCEKISALNLSKWNVSKVESFAKMFEFCSSLTSIGNVYNWNTGKVKSFDNMFNGCELLTSAGLGGNAALLNWDTSSLENASYMFYGCKKLTNVSVYRWVTPLLRDTSFMFYQSGITQFEMTSWNTEKLTNISNMFAGCSDLTSIRNFSAVGVTTANTYSFPQGSPTSRRAALCNLTFKTGLQSGKYAFRSNIYLKYCSFDTNGAQAMFDSLPDIKPLGYTRNITLTGNPCVTGVGVDGASCDTLTDSMKAVAVAKGWNIVA